MEHVKPNFKVPGDNDQRIMWEHGTMIANTKESSVWRFGFLDQSPYAGQYGVNSGKAFHWIIATIDGTVKEEFYGWAVELPLHYRVLMTNEEDLKHDRLVKHHEVLIRQYNWSYIKDYCKTTFEVDPEDNTKKVGRYYFGSESHSSAYIEALHNVAEENDLWVDDSGDPYLGELFICLTVDNEDN